VAGARAGARVSDPWLTSGDVAELLGVRRSTVYTYRSRGLLPEPGTRFGPTPLWRRSAIERWQAKRPGRGTHRKGRRR